MTFAEWEQQVPSTIRGDSVWKMRAYQLGLFFHDLAVMDAKKLRRDPLLQEMLGQLLRATSKISASVAEGYSRNTGKARATYYEYALGSTREARDWYYKSRHALPEKVTEHRLDIATQLIRLLLKMIATERRSNRRASG